MKVELMRIAEKVQARFVIWRVTRKWKFNKKERLVDGLAEKV